MMGYQTKNIYLSLLKIKNIKIKKDEKKPKKKPTTTTKKTIKMTLKIWLHGNIN